MTDLKRKGKAIGVKPRKQSYDKPHDKPHDKEQPNNVRSEMSVLHKIVISWLNHATFNNLLPSQKKYKEEQLQYMLNLEGLMGDKFPKEIRRCLEDNKDVSILLRRKVDEAQTKS